MYSRSMPEVNFKKQALQQPLLKFSLFNLALVAVLGLILRSYPFISIPFNYGNLLHGHSHFAFGGWVMPVLVWMIMFYFPELSREVAFYHWRNIIFLILFSAYGMLLSFPLQGYGAVSIFFSTISVFAGFYLAFIVWQTTKGKQQSISTKFLRAAVFYLVLSSIGPFATGPIIAMGKGGTPLYFNAIYFYLHFQYNGWFSFVILAVLTRIMEQTSGLAHGEKIFRLFNFACVPAFFLSMLWDHPGLVFYVVGGLAAIFQLVALFFLLRDFRRLKESNSFLRMVMNL